MAFIRLALSGTLALTGMAFGGDIILNPEAGGLQTTFYDVDGKTIVHNPEIPEDLGGTLTYLEAVCRSFNYDTPVKAAVLETTAYDLALQIWQPLPTSPRVYQSVTCAVYLDK